MERNVSRLGLPMLAKVLILLLVIGSVSAGVVIKAARPGGYPLLIDATIKTLTEGLECNKFTSVDLVRAYLARIAEVNNTFHAVTEVNPDALAIATALDTERSTGSIRGPLHGIPILIKNLIATNDKMNNTAGSWALVGAKVPRDSTVAKKLRAAGAILLGKANLSEWANARSSNSTDGWSALGGQVYGPYYPNQDPSGSSSGSAVATALGLATGTLGTETDGSIISPASFNNVVGIKPTVGLTSRYLVIPISEHQDTVGPLARTVKDAAIILQAIAGTDPRDNYTSVIPGGAAPDYVAACKYSALSGVRIGIPRNVISMSDAKYAPMIAAFEKAVKVLRHAGATVVDDTNFTAAAEFLNSNLPQVVINADIAVDLKKYFDSLTYNPRNITSLASLRDFTRSFSLEDYPDRDTGQWDEALETWNNTDPQFWPAYQQNLYYGGEGGLLGAIKRHNLDAVILPSELSSDWAAAVGSPIVSVPMSSYPAGTPVESNDRGLVESAPNMPFGLGFLGERFTEERLIGMAYAFEQRTKVRDKVLPYLKPSVELADIV
ncbi:glutamyl-tRNA amidotransferase subunit A [Cadophora sp. MPI-SDFR-AT-0126]|nr:glutamyl-tRNA amidotransferase subunit A [Leotiomycetes sp. MPI-SDFR-AT-0126]